MHTPALALIESYLPDRECCLLVLNSVTSTPQWIRQQLEPHDMHDVCVIVCKCAYIVLYNSKAFHSPDLFATLS
jgi:hypothetical protein